MPGRVIKVDRGKKLGGVERLYLPMILRALSVTTRHLLRNLRGLAAAKVQVPEEQVALPDAFRGVPVLVGIDDAPEGSGLRCVACGLCEFACPTDCIHIVAGELGDTGRRTPEVFEIDLSRCMFCGLCEEACPEEAIVMSQEVEFATFERAALRFDKHALRVPEAQLAPRLALLRAERNREAAAPVARTAPSVEHA